MIILKKDNNTRHTNNPEEAQEWINDGYAILKGVKEMSSYEKKQKPKSKKIKKK